MTSELRHLFVTGGLRSDRRRQAAAIVPDALTESVHRQLSGPYTGVEAVLRELLPSVRSLWPDLVEAHRVELLHGMPGLAAVIGPGPRMMATSTTYAQRTRFYSRMMLRSVNQGLVTFLRECGRRRVAAGEAGITFVFHDVSHASDTTQEFLACLIRRCDPSDVRVVLTSDGRELPTELDAVVRSHTMAQTVEVELPAPVTESALDLVRRFIFADGIGDDPAELSAYAASDPAGRAGLHDERADELEAAGRTVVGAIAYHREHGQDPYHAGIAALRGCVQFCVEGGFAPTTAEYAGRGRELADPESQTKEFADFTMQAGYALVDMGRLDDAVAMFMDLRQRYLIPRLHMMTSYAIGMVHTRFKQPRDHVTAAAWQNNALIIARQLSDEDGRLVQTGFMENGLALIEMHRHRLDYALELVESAIHRLDTELPPKEWELHRQQLVYNRARLLVVMGRPEPAYADLTDLVEADPYFTDYLTERAKVSRRAGRWAEALADYDRAIELAPPFPENFYTRATARREFGDLDGALADLRYVLDMEPGDLESRLLLVELCLEADRLSEAFAAIADGLALEPDSGRLLYLQAMAHLESGESELALAGLDRTLVAEPDLAAALVDRAVLRAESADYAGSVADLDQVLVLTGPDPDVLLNRGIVFTRMERFDEAVHDFDTALGLADVDTGEVHFSRSQAWRALGDLDRARSDLRVCADLGVHQAERAEIEAGSSQTSAGQMAVSAG